MEHCGYINLKYAIDKQGVNVFRYTNRFLKRKQEASDWPDTVQTDEEKAQYIRKYEEKEGILLDKSAIEKNPGLREMGKLMLNSFWGKVSRFCSNLFASYSV